MVVTDDGVERLDTIDRELVTWPTGGLTWRSNASCRPRSHGTCLLWSAISLAPSWRRGSADFEARKEFPRELVRLLGQAGLLGFPYDEDYGGGGSRTRSTCRCSKSLPSTWAAVALAVSVHTMSCYPLVAFGTDEQRDRWLPDMVGGELLGAYCLSEAQSGSDAAALAHPSDQGRRTTTFSRAPKRG